MVPYDAQEWGITALDTSQCTYDYFRQHHLLPNKPAVLPASLIEDWPVCYWRTSGGDCEATTSPLHTFRDIVLADSGACLVGAEDEPSFETLGDLLDAWEQGKAKGVYLKDWHLPLWLARQGDEESVSSALYSVPEICKDDWMNEYYGAETNDDFRFVYAGGGETFTPLHRDVYCSYSISSNLLGAKLWHLFPPSCTRSLLLIITAAEREGASVDVRDWTSERMAEFSAKGMIVVRQEQGETIFIPSGYYHQVTNLSHPTISLNHNWCNSHNIRALYYSMCDEVSRCREAIDDVREMLERKGDGPDWRVEWESCVAELVKQSAGWNWSTFWAMVRHALRCIVEPVARSPKSRWPSVDISSRPPPAYVVEQIKPIFEAFKARSEEERALTEGRSDVLEEVYELLRRLE